MTTKATPHRFSFNFTVKRKGAGSRLKVISHIFLLFLCYPQCSFAKDSLHLSIAQISVAKWALTNIQLAISLHEQSPQFSLSSAELILPPPLNHLSSVRISCQKIKWDENYLNCSAGQGRFTFRQFNTLSFNFSLVVDQNHSQIKISQLSFMGGKIAIDAQQKDEKWQVLISAKGVNLEQLNTLFPLAFITVNQGLADIDIQLAGEQSSIQELQGSASIKKLYLQNEDESLVSENIVFKTEIKAVKKKSAWQWHSKHHILAGGMYMEPIYLDLDKNTLSITANGVWQPDWGKTRVNRLTLEHSEVLKLQATAELNHRTGISIEVADIAIQIPQLKSAAPTYLLPFLESSLLAGIDLAGAMDVRLNIHQDTLSSASLILKNLMLDDSKKNLYINQANAQIHWAMQQNNTQASFINWQALKIQAIPLAAGQLDFISFDKQLKLSKQADLAVLDGIISINNFSFAAAKSNDDATVHFNGSINNLSLEQLSTALDWTPLSGTISGYIPSVSYQNKKLSLDGELKMQVFDGEITISNLASSGLFSKLPQFYTDIEFDQLDLGALTHKLHMGYIEGRLSGFVQNLYLEDWQPISFYAWLGTPEGDNSTHKISQKAVENIASIGGGGVSDVLSRGFLGLFSTFGYKQLGFGCYLYQGVCQLMGVEAIDNGFYLIKGGGLPRIDVIGYTPRLDWKILVNSLKRITASDEVIIK